MSMLKRVTIEQFMEAPDELGLEVLLDAWAVVDDGHLLIEIGHNAIHMGGVFMSWQHWLEAVKYGITLVGENVDAQRAEVERSEIDNIEEQAQAAYDMLRETVRGNNMAKSQLALTACVVWLLEQFGARKALKGDQGATMESGN